MAFTIVRRARKYRILISDVSGETPTLAQLDANTLGFNAADNLWFMEDSSTQPATVVQANTSMILGTVGANLTPAVRTNNPTIGANKANANIAALDKAIGTDAQVVSFPNITVNSSVNQKCSALDLAVYFLQQAATFNSTSASIDAAGNSQATATAVATGIAVVALADGTKAIKLPAVSTTKVITIFNTVANQDLVIYPATSEYLNAAAQNASIKFKHATLISSVVCTYQSAGKWTVTAIVGTIS